MQISQNKQNYNACKQNPKFGFNYETHRAITKKALEFVPELTEAIAKFSADKALKQKFLGLSTVKDELVILNDNPALKKKLLNKPAVNPLGLGALIEKLSSSEEVQTKFRQEIADASMLPDLLKEEIGFYTSSHFYFPPTGKQQRISFGPKEDINNARFAFAKHITNALMPFSDQKHLIPKETGLALHFLQDMTVPMHTRRQSLMGKVKDFFMHREFEIQMLENQEKLLSTYKPEFEKLRKEVENNPVTHCVHTDTFLANCRFSSQPHLQVYKNNKKDWETIQQQIFNRAVDSTVVELKNLANRIKELV